MMLKETIRSAPEEKHLQIVGVSGRVGARLCRGKGIGPINPNGAVILDVPFAHYLAVSNRFFAKKVS